MGDSVLHSQATAGPVEPSVLSSQSLGGRPLSAGDQTGRKIGAYTLGLHLATGAFGHVYVAQGPMGECAFKLGPLTDHRRFERELNALRGINHPGLIRYLDGGTFAENGREFYWLAMEYPGPITLADLIGRGPMHPAGAIAIFRQILDALEALHNGALIHRDLKPSNILVNSGSAKLIDFGLTKSMVSRGHEALTLTGQIVGTPRYMSPEQVNGMREVGPASDVWSAIVIFYEMLTGVPLFDGANEMQLGAQILGADLDARISSQYLPVFLRPWFLEFLDRADPLNRCNVGQVRASFERAVEQFQQREQDVASRAAWSAIREQRVVESLFESGVSKNSADISRAFKSRCDELELSLPPQDEVEAMLSAASEAFTGGGLHRLTAELGGHFQRVKSRTPENLELKRQAGLRHKWRAYAWFLLSAVFCCVCLAGFVLVVSNDKKKNPTPDYRLIFLGVVSMLGGGAATAWSFVKSAKSWNRYTDSLPAPQFGVSIPSWDECPGRFFCFEKLQYWETREQLSPGEQRVEFKLDLGFEAAPLATDTDLLELLPLTRLSVLQLNRCKRLTDSAMEVVAQLPYLKWLDISDSMITEKGLAVVLNRVFPARLDLGGCINLKSGVTGLLADARIFELDLGFNDWVGPASLRVLGANASFRSLSLAGCRNADDQSMEYLAALPLKTLNLRWCEKVTDPGLAAIGRMQFLENLDLRGLSRITDAGLLALSGLKFLKLLHVAECAQITERGIGELRRALPLCRIDARGEFELPRYLY